MNSQKTTFDMNEDEKRAKAREIAEMRYWFRWNLLLYPIVNVGLFAIWYITGPLSFVWPLIPAGFWTVGLIAHYITAYRSIGVGWIEKETAKVLQDLS
ncbi:MAG: 2TM domain-containing protein [Candidatus Thorarchaeota archaeon]|jgi:hypothetical protein